MNMYGATREYTAAEAASIRKYCDHDVKAMAGAPRCPFPKCFHPSCRGEIEGGLRKMKIKEKT